MTSRVGWVIPQDRIPPRTAVQLASDAEKAGFCGVLAADTFAPWLPDLAQAPFMWNLLSAAGEHTTGSLMGGMAVAGYRMHPAAIAQAIATLAALHPGRVQVSFAPGEAINEHVAGGSWPEAAERIDRMFAALELIQKLLKNSTAGKDTRYRDEFFRLDSTRIWTLPEVLPELLVTTSGPLTAYRAGRVADGLIVVAGQVERAGRLLQRFSDGVRAAHRKISDTVRVAYVTLSWAQRHDDAVAQATERYPIGAMRFARGDLRSPHTVAQISQLVRPEDFGDALLITERPEDVRAVTTQLLDAGFGQVYLNNVGDNHREFIDMCSSEVLPTLSGN